MLLGTFTSPDVRVYLKRERERLMRIDRIRPALRMAIMASALVGVACHQDHEKLKQEFLASGDAYMKQEKYAEAAIQYQSAIQQDDHFAQARFKLAGTYIRMGNGTKALAEASRAADLMPNDSEAQLQAANLLILAGRFPDAEDRARRVLARNPQDVRATVALGNALAGLKDLDGAVGQLEEAIRLDPTRSGSYTTLATLQLGAGRLKEAEMAYVEAVRKSPKSITSRMALAQFYWLTNRVKDAESQVLQAVDVSPRDVGVNRFASAFYQATSQSEKAEKYFKTAVDVDGTSHAHLALAEYYIAASRFPDASAILKTLADDKEVGTIARVRLATIDYSSGHTAEATAAIDAILKDKPQHVDALLSRRACWSIRRNSMTPWPTSTRPSRRTLDLYPRISRAARYGRSWHAGTMPRTPSIRC
jgi:tetratricopeptide (TPR) repeat protein